MLLSWSVNKRDFSPFCSTQLGLNDLYSTSQVRVEKDWALGQCRAPHSIHSLWSGRGCTNCLTQSHMPCGGIHPRSLQQVLFQDLNILFGMKRGQGGFSCFHILTIKCDYSSFPILWRKHNDTRHLKNKWSLRNDHQIFFPKWKIGKLLQRASPSGSQTSLHWPIAFEALLKFIKTQDSQVPLHSYWFRMTSVGNQVSEFSTSLWDQPVFEKPLDSDFLWRRNNEDPLCDFWKENFAHILHTVHTISFYLLKACFLSFMPLALLLF